MRRPRAVDPQSFVLVGLDVRGPVRGAGLEICRLRTACPRQQTARVGAEQ